MSVESTRNNTRELYCTIYIYLTPCACILHIASPFPDFPSNPPARATFAVKDLPKGGLVEIEAVAVHH